jgi:plasmid stabilization system protein ParE
MKIIWHQDAKNEYKQIARYIKLKFGLKAKREFITGVMECEKFLCKHPDIASIDPLFDDRVKTYRSVLINRRSKMVYYIEGEEIHIAAFWDCRRDPVAQAEQVNE